MPHRWRSRGSLLFSDACYQTSWPVLHFDTLDSSNAHAIRLTEGSDSGPYWIHADRQTAGRGRLGRDWISPEGNLYATALFPFEGKLAEAPLVCFVAGLAVTDVIAKRYPEVQNTVQLKWPNDIVVSEKKLGGILIETGSRDSKTWMAAGFGINLKSSPGTLGRPTIALADLAKEPYLPSEFLEGLDFAFRRRMTDLANNGFRAARADWLRRTVHTGKKVSYALNGQKKEATFDGLDTDGALIVRDETGQTHHVRAGEVGLIG